MSQVKVSGNASGTGIFEIAAPNASTNYTLTLPQATTTLVGTDATQTLTNKTYTNPTFSGTASGTVIVSGTAQASTSGTSIDYTGIPSWVKRITVMLSGVSTSGTSQLQIQLGTGAGPTFTTSGYVSIVGNIVSSIAGAASYTSGLVFATNISASTSTRGSIIISNITSNTWVSQGVAYSRGDTAAMSSGDIALGAALTALRVTTVNGTDTFDAGSINILYE